MSYLPKPGEVWKHRERGVFMVREIVMMAERPDPVPIILGQRLNEDGVAQKGAHAFSSSYWEVSHAQSLWHRIHPPQVEMTSENREKRRRGLKRWRTNGIKG